MDAVIVVAGGKGVRMGSDVPKQFVPLCGLPVLMHTLYRIREAVPGAEIIVVLPREHKDYWLTLCGRYHFTVPHRTVAGGSSRYESVSNGLNACHVSADSIIAVHDGVRPFVSVDVIKRSFEIVREKLAVVPAVNPVETMRTGSMDDSRRLSRDACWLVQTPQVFMASVIKEAYEHEYDMSFTDDASVVESTGHRITLIEGNRENVKLTTPMDLAWAEAWLTQKKAR